MKFIRNSIFTLIIVNCLAVVASETTPSQDIEERIISLIVKARQTQNEDSLKAIAIVKEAIELADKHQITVQQGVARSGLAVFLSYIGRHDEAITIINEAMSYFQSLGASIDKARTIRFAGFVYANDNRYEEALFYYHQAHKMLLTLPGDFEKTVRAQNGDIVNIYLETGQYDKAEKLLLTYVPDLPGTTLPDILDFYLIADVYIHKQEPEKAIPYAEKVIKWGESEQEKFAISQGQYMLAMAQLLQWEQQENPESLQQAYTLFSEALAFSETLSTKRSDHLIKLIGLARAQFYLQDTAAAQSSFQEALSLAQSLNEVPEEIEIREWLLNISANLAPAEALNHARAINSLSEKTYRAIYSDKIAQLFVDYDLLTTENQLQKVRLENIELEQQRTTNMLIAISSALLILFTGGYLWRLVTLKARQKDLEKEVKKRTLQLSTSEQKYRELFNVTLLEKERTEAALKQERVAIQNNLNFIDMISHEYRTPLAVIDSSLSLLEKDEERKAMTMARMKQSMQKLLHLFETSLTEFRLKEDFMLKKPEVVNIDSFLRMVLDYERRAHEDHMIELSIRGNHALKIHVDPDLMNIALTNIVSNACKYSTTEHPIKLEASATVCESEPYVCIKIIDQGVGIREEELHRIFEKYYRASTGKSQKGTGVGLFLVKRIIELHQGSIDVTSEMGKGSTFIVLLPKVD